MLMKLSPSSSLIISTYNWPQALELCLLSVKQQSQLPTEVIIADDGSGNDTRKLIEEFQKDFPVPLVHLWQEDEGFQLAKVRNKGIVKASGEYIIQIDGDLVLHKDFVRDHLYFAEPGYFASGSRILMSEELSKNILEKKNVNISIFSKGIKNFFNGIHFILLSKLFATRYKSNDPYYVKGCNMAFWKVDLYKVNGYNEAFVGWGREDSELAIRLINSGLKKKYLKFSGIVFHTWHKESDRGFDEENTRKMKEAITNRITWCEKGLDQYK